MYNACVRVCVCVPMLSNGGTVNDLGNVRDVLYISHFQTPFLSFPDSAGQAAVTNARGYSSYTHDFPRWVCRTLSMWACHCALYNNARVRVELRDRRSVSELTE